MDVYVLNAASSPQSYVLFPAFNFSKKICGRSVNEEKHLSG